MLDFGASIPEIKKELDGILRDFYKEYLELCQSHEFGTKMNVKTYLIEQYKMGYENKLEMSSKNNIFIYNPDFRSLQQIQVKGDYIFVKKYIIDYNELDKFIYTNIEMVKDEN